MPYPFTMNWQLTRPGHFRFERGEPFCVIFPVAQNALESTQPEVLDLQSNPVLLEQHAAWRGLREEFMTRFRTGDEKTLREAWSAITLRESGLVARNKSRITRPSSAWLLHLIDYRPRLAAALVLTA